MRGPDRDLRLFLWVCVFGVTLFVLGSFFTTDACGMVRQPRVDAMASVVAGKPVTVECYVESSEWFATQQAHGFSAGDALLGFAYIGGNRIYMGPTICRPLLSGELNGASLSVLAHEAAHSQGVQDESWANCWGRAWVFDLAHRFYGVKAFTERARALERQAAAMSALNPPEYRRYGC